GRELQPRAGGVGLHHEAVRSTRPAVDRREGPGRRDRVSLELTVIQTQLASIVRSAVERAQASGDLPEFYIPSFQLERPARKEHGDWSTSIALEVAKDAKRKPRDVADAIVKALNAEPADHIAATAVAGPGFIN